MKSPFPSKLIEKSEISHSVLSPLQTPHKSTLPVQYNPAPTISASLPCIDKS